jgi:hypothetical protein
LNSLSAEPVGTSRGLAKSLVALKGLDEEEVFAFGVAGGRVGGGAVDGGDLRSADQDAECGPIADCAVSGDWTHGQLAEGGLAEGLQGIEGGDGGVFVLQDEVVGGK